GNPPMNLFPTRATVDGRGVTGIRLGSQSIPITPRRTIDALMRSKPDTALTGGIRPEAFELVADGSAPDAVQATVAHVEYLGHETLAYVRGGDAADEAAVHLTARFDGMHTLSKGQAINLRVDAGRIDLFDEAGEV